MELTISIIIAVVLATLFGIHYLFPDDVEPEPMTPFEYWICIEGQRIRNEMEKEKLNKT
jgi:hypothetical protein